MRCVLSLLAALPARVSPVADFRALVHQGDRPAMIAALISEMADNAAERDR